MYPQKINPRHQLSKKIVSGDDDAPVPGNQNLLVMSSPETIFLLGCWGAFIFWGYMCTPN